MLLGLGLSVLSGILDGSTTLPLHFVRKWRWENIWLIFCATMMVAVPLVTVSVTLPDPHAFYDSPLRTLLVTTALFGLGFGFGNLIPSLDLGVC